MAGPDLDGVLAARLRRTLAAVAAAHPFYRARFRELRIEAGDIRSLGDLAALPLTQKDDFIADPEAFRLRPDDLPADFSAEERVLWDVAYTTGTTSGKPSPFYNTAHDAYAIWDQARRCNEAEGLDAGDRVANLYPLAGFPTGAFLSVIRSGMVVGFSVAHGLTGAANSEFKVRNSLPEAVATIARFRPTVLWGVPSFIRRFLDEAGRRGADLSDVQRIVTSGEPVPAALRAELRQQLSRLGAIVQRRRELAALRRHSRGQFGVLFEVPYCLEVVDPATGRSLPDGESGMLAITHLHRRGTVLLRYLVGDVVTLARAPCPHCGRDGERVVATPRRTGGLVKCRGMLVNTEVILDTLSAMAGLGEFQIVFAGAERPGAMERLVIRIERDTETDASLRDEVTQRVRAAVSLRPDVEFVARGALYDQERSIKAKRVVDLRAKMD